MATNQRLIGILISSTLLFATACSEKNKSTKVISNITNEVTATNYLNGKAFCHKYAEITKQQFGRFVRVPLDYSNPDAGTMEIYAWTNKPFNPSLKTFIYLEGGPGGNTHGGSDFLAIPSNVAKYTKYYDQWNQINIDQRGLGCSAPATFELYKNTRIYSSQNTALDMDEVRKAYGILKWSVYGISYGTIPATIYASKFPDQTGSLVIEGVVGNPTGLDSSDSNVSKSNQILQKLTDKQRESFKVLWRSERYKAVLESFFSRAMYVNGGYKIFQEFLLEVLAVKENGAAINYQLLDQYEKILKDADKEENTAQAPGTVDEQVFSTLYCKELYHPVRFAYFDEDSFRFYSSGVKSRVELCKGVGIDQMDMTPYYAKNYPVLSHVTYFQGTHDGATPADGAVEHWLNSPQGSSQFLLSTRGGHTPMLQRLRIYKVEGSTLQQTQKKLTLTILNQNAFSLAMSGLVIPDSIIGAINLQLEADEQWFAPTKSAQGLEKIYQASQNVRSENIF